VRRREALRHHLLGGHSRSGLGGPGGVKVGGDVGHTGNVLKRLTVMGEDLELLVELVLQWLEGRAHHVVKDLGQVLSQGVDEPLVDAHSRLLAHLLGPLSLTGCRERLLDPGGQRSNEVLREDQRVLGLLHPHPGQRASQALDDTRLAAELTDDL